LTIFAEDFELLEREKAFIEEEERSLNDLSSNIPVIDSFYYVRTLAYAMACAYQL
jgi:hypothetical protein